MHEHFQRYLLINVGIILGSFLAFGVIFYIFSNYMDGKVDQILANRSAIVQRSTDLESLNKLKTDTAAAVELQKSIDALLPPQDLLISFPQFLNNLARSHSLSSTFNFDGSPIPASLGAPGHVDFTVGIEGDAANIRSFVQELERKTTKFMVNLQGLTMTPRGSIYHADLRGQVFFQENKVTPT